MLSLTTIAIILLGAQSVRSTGVCRYQTYVMHKGSKLQNHVVTSIYTRNYLACEALCTDTPSCQSYNWRQQNSTCEISSSTNGVSPVDFVTETGWAYFQKYDDDASCAIGEASTAGCTKTGLKTSGCKGCIEAAGMEDNSIPDSHITATSSYLSASWGPHLARLNHPTAWSDHTLNQNQYIQVVLNQQQYVTGVITQGKNDAWVKKYKVEFTSDDVNWQFVSDDGTPKIFAGNTDIDTAVTNIFPESIIASIVRLRPTEWHHTIHVRMEWLGCAL
ncbi:lactadherin-like [Amphiura filiformis]|uniref:lactadherin-like n=1 Tax=Amphiura filiformis TaxID=82378 RepID=UPI003B21F955